MTTSKTTSKTKNIQIRNVPEDLHRRLKIRAAQQGRSMSELILKQLERSLGRPTHEELLDRIAARGPVETTNPIVDMIREARAER